MKYWGVFASSTMLSREFELTRDQIMVLVIRDFKRKYNSTYLGFFWSLLVPIFTSLVYCVVFQVLIRWSTEHYILYLMSGNFLWHFFNNVITMNGRVLINSAPLLKKTCFDRKFLIYGTFVAEFIHFLLTIPILFGMMCFFKITPQWSTLFINLLSVFVFTSLLCFGVSFLYAAANLYFRDLERVIGVIMMSWMFMSPIFIPMSHIPEKYQIIYQLNPMAGIMCIWRDIFYCPGFHPESFLYLFAVCFVVFLIGYGVFQKCEPGFAEMM